ncbi:MAG TPA: CocE/NonD family hydrolase [Verrucomicrobiae bacterium]
MKTVKTHGRSARTISSISRLSLIGCAVVVSRACFGAELYDPPDRGQPGDAMIQEYLRLETGKIEADFLSAIKSAEEWTSARPRFREEYFDMLGLWPLPDKTPLHATVTRTLNRGDYVVDMVHYQSRPGLYVTGNLYRPAKTAAGARLPAILYVCGHSPRPRNGNKTAYQSHGIWFARRGYVCLVLDTLEMGELTCTHHGTYREGRWWWLSRGYTPAGVECWNGVRGIDYLSSRPDVDPGRIGVTGISGGGAATTWISAADERVTVSVPVSGWSDLVSHVAHRVVNGHCDCMFNYNIYQWPYARVLGMIAPRPLLFVNSDADTIFPMDGNERLINRLERLYSLFGAGDIVDSVVSVGGHAYRQDIRQAAFRFMNIYLKEDSRAIQDSEVDLVTSGPNEVHPIPPEQLRVFPQDSDFPKDAINSRIDYEFVPLAKPALPEPAQFEAWKAEKLQRLRQLAFHHFPERIPAATTVETNGTSIARVNTEPAISIRLRAVRLSGSDSTKVWLYISGSDVGEAPPAWFSDCAAAQDGIYVCEPRGIGGTRWTTKNPPNYVERSHYLLGRTVDSGRVWDIIASARYLHALHNGKAEVYLAGDGPTAVLATYAALLEPDVAGLGLSRPPASHMATNAPPLLGVLRVLDVPQAIGLLAPRPVTIIGLAPEIGQTAAAIYRVAGAAGKLVEQK